jgi:hypothetical protein
LNIWVAAGYLKFVGQDDRQRSDNARPGFDGYFVAKKWYKRIEGQVRSRGMKGVGR